MESNPIDLILSGASGKMGREILKLVMENDEFRLIGALEHENCVEIGQDAVKFIGQNSGITITDNAASISFKSQNNLVLIDFSYPKNTIKMLEICVSKSIGMVIGTTGFSEKELLLLRHASKTIPILFAPNMSLGVNKVFAIVKEAVKHFSDNYDVEIFEAHHRDKLDAPSGTALKMGSIIADALGLNPEDSFCFSRNGRKTNRGHGEIGFSVVRGGDIVGQHKVIFAGNGEQIEITHNSNSRKGYALGALEAARFLSKKNNPGFFGMDDVIS